MSRQTLRGLALGVMILTGVTACQDLDIVNENNPDSSRALSNPEDLEALIAGALNEWLAGMHGRFQSDFFPNYSAEMTSTTNVAGMWTEAREPRGPHGNLVSIAASIGPWGPRTQWAQMLSTLSVTDDLLRLTDPDAEEPLKIIIGGEDRTPRARAFAKLMQGLSWGTLANLFDQVLVIKETEELPTSAEAAVDRIVSADQALQDALDAIDAAIAIAQANPNMSFPDDATAPAAFFGATQAITSQMFIQLANTMAARFIVMHARTPQERAAVDWQAVLARTQNGLTYDLDVVLSTDRASVFFQFAQLEQTPVCTSCYRWDNYLIGRADISGNYQAWVAASNENKLPFQITTPDRRITGATPTSRGAYTHYLATMGCCILSRGTYFRSHYQWRRHAHELGLTGLLERGEDQGVAHIATVDENNLLRAEAMFRTGNAAGARDLVNISRTRMRTMVDGSQAPGLPAATIQGAPHSAPGANDCVPRTDSGQCGDLLVTIMYERMIELAGQDAIRGYLDSRGFGMLVDDSFYELPIPANEADQFGTEIYTFGGAGGESSAVYAPAGGGWSGNP